MSSFDPANNPPGGPLSLSGLTVDQAKEFHGLFQVVFAVFLVIAILAHVAAWTWRPWGKATEPSQLRTPPTATSLLTPSQASAPTLKAA